MADSSSSIGDSLTYKLGPLPAWAWGVGLGVSFIAYRTIKDRIAGSSAPAPATSTDETAAGDDVIGGVAPDGWTGSPMGGGTWVPAPVTGDPDLDVPEETETGPATNDAWRRLAGDYLTSTGLWTGTQINDALVKFLDGEPMTEAEIAIVNAALRALGQPPDNAPPIVRAAAPAAPQAPQTPVAPRPVTRTPAPPAARTRPNLVLGSKGKVVSNLSFWLNTYSDGKVPAPWDTYHAGHDRAVNNLIRFMNRGARPGSFGTTGVNSATWGLIDFVSAMNKHTTVTPG